MLRAVEMLSGLIFSDPKGDSPEVFSQAEPSTPPNTNETMPQFVKNPKLDELRNALELKESDKTWMDIDSAIQELTTLYSTEPSMLHELNRFLLEMRPALEASILTDRTRLSGSAVSLIQQIAETLKSEFHPLVEWTLPALLKLLTRTNKVVITRATSCILTITKATQLTAIVPLFADAMKSPSKTLRLTAMKAILTVIENFQPQATQTHEPLIEASIREGAVDSTPEVREASRLTYAAYIKTFPDQRSPFNESLSEVARKYLIPKPVSKSTRPASSFKKFMAQKPRSDSPVIPAQSLKNVQISDGIDSCATPLSPPSSNCQTPMESAAQEQPCDLSTGASNHHSGLSSPAKIAKSLSHPTTNSSAFEALPGTS